MMKGWISVGKELPELGVNVLVTDGKIASCAERYKCACIGEKWYCSHVEGYEWEWELDACDDGDKITHWMHVPDLPNKLKEKV